MTRTLIAAEVKRFFSLPWNLRIAVLAVPAIGVALWEYMPSPFIPIFAALFIGLEPQFCNIFYQTPNEFEALSVMPIPWRGIILAKNLSSLLITLVCLPILSVTVIYFYPDPVPAPEFGYAGLYLLSVVFPLLHVGNLQSLQHPRRHPGWHTDDLAGAIIMAGFSAVLSIPYLILVEAAGSPLLCLLYSGFTGYLWFRYSLSNTSNRLLHSASILCTAQ